MKPAEKPLLISCAILRKEIEQLVQNGDLDVQVHFLNETLHMDYNRLDLALCGVIQKRLPKCPHGIIVVYGDVCLGFNGEMKKRIAAHDVIKVNALNCIDCLLGGQGRLLEIDPDHKYLFLNPAFMRFGKKIRDKPGGVTREMFGMLDGIVLLDALGDLDDHTAEIEDTVEYTGLPVLQRKNIGLDGLKSVLLEALGRNRRKYR